MVSLRAIADGDAEFLYRVYAGTRTEELAPLAWTAAEKESFLRWQFAAQHKYYQEHYNGAAFDIIRIDDADAGRLYVFRGPREIRLMDIALLPEFRGRGVGTRLVSAILDEGRATSRTVTLYVEHNNPARRMYDRFGFRQIGENGVYLQMEWRPESA